MAIRKLWKHTPQKSGSGPLAPALFTVSANTVSGPPTTKAAGRTIVSELATIRPEFGWQMAKDQTKKLSGPIDEMRAH